MGLLDSGAQPERGGFPRGGFFPMIDAAGMAEVDRLMVEDFGITLPQMMENAGRALAILAAERFLGGQVAGKSVTVLAGGGGNGGGVMVAARRLIAWGARVRLVLADAARLRPVPRAQAEILARMGVHQKQSGGAAPDLILDGLVGYSLRNAPSGRVAELIHWANGSRAPILALDVPSGFDAASGVLCDPHIRAAATLTLALPKRGLSAPAQREAVGELYLADISVPPALYDRLSVPLNVPPFSGGDILRIGG